MPLILPARESASSALPVASGNDIYWQEFDAAVRQLLGPVVPVAAIVAAALTLTGLPALGSGFRETCVACQRLAVSIPSTIPGAAPSLASHAQEISRTTP